MRLPDKETARHNGWTHQVDWVEDGKPCMIRCKSNDQANSWLVKLQREGLDASVTDLEEAYKEH